MTQYLKIAITPNNAEKVEAALAETNGTATSFTVTTYGEVAAFAEQVERMLDASGLPKGERSGASATARPCGPSAKSYRYAAKSTKIMLKRGAKGWFLVGAAEVHVYPKAPEIVAVTITPAQADTIARKALAGYQIASGDE